MGVQKLEDRFKRKLFTVGYQRSYAVTLPIEFIRKHGWRSGQLVAVEPENSVLVIRAVKTKTK